MKKQGKKDHWQVTDFKKRHHYLFDKERSMYTLFSICSLIRRHETNSTFQFLFPPSVISFSFQVLSLSLSILLSRFHRVRQLLWQDRHRVLKSVFRTKQMLEIINIFISIFYWQNSAEPDCSEGILIHIFFLITATISGCDFKSSVYIRAWVYNMSLFL